MGGVPPGLIRALQTARNVVVLTGSGVSAESGVPTFREAQTGLWERYDPQQLATPEAFMRDPELVWNWYAWRRGLVNGASPNRGHLALAELERSVPSFTLVTQNVDGLHREAGSRNVLELHGNIRRTRCPAEKLIVEPGETGATPPVCPNCGVMLRPDVVWFGEALPEEELSAAIEATRGCDLFFSVGTSGVVYPAAGLPYEALAAGALLVEINPQETPLTPHTTWFLRGNAGETLPSIVRTVFLP